MTFSVLHIKDNRPLIEPTVDHSGSHVKWNVTSLSPVGPIIQTTQSVEHHGVVLVYKQLGSDNNNYSFHIYLATNSASDITVSECCVSYCCKVIPGSRSFLFFLKKSLQLGATQVEISTSYLTTATLSGLSLVYTCIIQISLKDW